MINVVFIAAITAIITPPNVGKTEILAKNALEKWKK